MLLVMPLFDRQRFPYWRYQALGITRTSRKIPSGPIAVEPPAQWTGTLILKLIDHVRNDEGRPALDYYLIGHSAGAQIVNRFAALVPNGARRIVIANPSSYMRPTRQARFPYGFGDLPQNMADESAVRRYLAQPITILVGTADLGTGNLDLLPPAMQQGATRYERGRNAFHAAQDLARDKGWEFNWRLIEVPGVGHDARGMYHSPQAEAALFGR
jgi:pimeloyl-ACP methyl ester carboxylesterase